MLELLRNIYITYFIIDVLREQDSTILHFAFLTLDLALRFREARITNR